jgi:DNA-binding FadR family transcriptional regulator
MSLIQDEESRASLVVPLQAKPKTATLLAQRIVEEITALDLQPGAALPPEREMLQRYGVARGTLREALRFLEIQGVVRIKPGPGGGPTVSEVEPRALGNIISLLLHLRRVPFSTIIETRQVLEPVIASLAATQITDADIERLRESVTAMEEQIGNAAFFLAENRRFHDIVAHAAGNELFALLLGSLGSIFDASAIGVSYDERDRKAIVKAHHAIVDAIAAHDAAAAEEAMRDHTNAFARYMLKNYRASLAQALRWDVAAL